MVDLASGTNGGGDPLKAYGEQDAREYRALEQQFHALESSIMVARSQFARMAGITFDGRRDLYEVFGYARTLTTQDYRDRYARGGIAARIIDAMPNATWRGEVEIIENDNPKTDTAFEQAWVDLDTRLQIQAKLRRVDILAGLSTYAVLLIGADGSLDTELPKGQPEKLLYLQPFLGGGGPAQGKNRTTTAGDADCTIDSYDLDPASERFGLPQFYRLRRTEVSAPQMQKPVHWTRVLHIAEGLLDDDVYGQPQLERIWNLLDDLDKVTGGGAEAFFLRANQGLHLDIDKDMSLDAAKDTVAALKEQAEAYKHQLTRWLRTRGVTVETLGSDVANFASPADAVLTQIAGAKAMPKRILTGSEMGELASSQDRDNWKDQINGRQTGYAGPYIVRPLVDRLIAYGYLPAPAKGPQAYEVRWPHIETLTEDEKAAGTQKWAATNQSNPTLVFTEDEIRDKWYGMEPLTPKQKAQAIADKQAQSPIPTPMAMGPDGKPLPGKPGAPPFGKKPAVPPPGTPQARAAEAFDELADVLDDAIACNNVAVIDSLLGLDHGLRVAYDPDQPRDDKGQWTETGGGGRASGDTRASLTLPKGPSHPTPEEERGRLGKLAEILPKTQAEQAGIFDPDQAYIRWSLERRAANQLPDARPTPEQTQKLHDALAAVTRALRDPDIGMALSEALTGVSPIDLEARLDEMRSGVVRRIPGGKAPDEVVTMPVKRAASEDVITPILNALRDPETRAFVQQLIADLQAAGSWDALVAQLQERETGTASPFDQVGLPKPDGQ